jgi:hypothetical protein
MALKKATADRSGNSGDYWRVDQIHIHRESGKMEARIHQYKSKADQADGKANMEGMKTLVIDIPEPALKLILAAFYKAAKTTTAGDQAPGDEPFFKDALEA